LGGYLALVALASGLCANWGEQCSRGFDLSYSTLSARLRALHLCPLKPAKPTATGSSQRDQAVGRPRSQEDTVIVIVADEPPQLTPGAARVLLRILLKAADRNDAESQGDRPISLSESDHHRE